MKQILLSLVVAVSACAFASSAAASGPAAPGKQLFEVNCEGVGAITVSVAPSVHASSAGQAVGLHLHGIPVATTFTATDVTTSTVLVNETQTKPGHTNLGTTPCKLPTIEEEASKLFGEELPPGVSPTDIIRIEAVAHVVLKP